MILLIASPSNLMGNSFFEISDVSGMIEAFAAVFNLVIIIGFFIKEREETRSKERNRIKEERYVNWYKLLVLERLLAELDEYFEDIVQLFLEAQQGVNTVNIGVTSKKINEIKNKFSQKKRILLPTLSLFNDDLKKEVWKIFQENCDLVLEEMEKLTCQKASNNKALELISEDKMRIYSKLYSFDLEQLNEIVCIKDKQ